MPWIKNAAAGALVTTLFTEEEPHGPPVVAPEVKDTDDKRQHIIDLMNWVYSYDSFSAALGIQGLRPLMLKEEDTKRRITDEEAKDEFCLRHAVESNKVKTIDVLPNAKERRVDYSYLTADDKVYATTSVQYYGKDDRDKGEFWTTNDPSHPYIDRAHPDNNALRPHVVFGFRQGNSLDRRISLEYGFNREGEEVIFRIPSGEPDWNGSPGKGGNGVRALEEAQQEEKRTEAEKSNPGMTLNDARQELQNLKSKIDGISFSADEADAGAGTGMAKKARKKELA